MYSVIIHNGLCGQEINLKTDSFYAACITAESLAERFECEVKVWQGMQLQRTYKEGGSW